MTQQDYLATGVMDSPASHHEPPWWQRSSRRRLLNGGIIYLLVLPGAIVFLIPLLWMLSTALKESKQIFANPPVWIPDPIVWSNFSEGWGAYLPFNTFFVNSSLITLNNIVGNLFSCCLAAYGFARLRARGRNILFALVLATMLLPNEVLIIPQYVLFTRITQFLKPWWDFYTPNGILWMRYLSWLPLMVPPWFGFPFFIFLLRQFFLTIPLDLDEAARLDGASSWRILAQILIPLTKPALATVVIFAFIGNWNNFLMPLIYIRAQKEQVLAVGLNQFRGQFGHVDFHYMMAVSLIVLLPVLLVFFFGQRLFVQGIALTGIKG